MKMFSQIAIAVKNHDLFLSRFESLFGVEMYSDHLLMSGKMRNRKITDSPLTLSFNHDVFNGSEIEFITSNDPNHWHNTHSTSHGPFLSHLGVYCTDKEFDQLFEKFYGMDFEILQNTTSHSHTNKREGDGEKSSRSYTDVIFDTESYIGFNVKLSRKNNG